MKLKLIKDSKGRQTIIDAETLDTVAICAIKDRKKAAEVMRAFAAAYDLLHACESVQDTLDSCNAEYWFSEKLDKALAKARG